MTFAIGALFLAPLLWLPVILYMAYRSGNHLLPRRTEPLYNRFFFLFAFFAMVSGILSLNWQVAACSLAIPGFYILTVYLSNYCDSREKVLRIIELCFFFAALTAVIGLIWEIFDISKQPNAIKFFFGVCDVMGNPKNADRLVGTFYNANVAASFYSCALFAGIYLLNRLRGKQRYYVAAGELLVVVALLLTDSRGALLGVFVGLVFYFGCRRNKIFAVVAGVIFISWLAVLLFAPNIIERGGEILLADMDARWRIWADGLEQFLAKPVFGWGFAGAFLYTGTEYDFMAVVHPHNMILTALSFYGAVGFALCCALEIVKIKLIFGMVRIGDDLAPLFLAISGVYWGQGIFDCTFTSPQGGIFYFGASALLIALSRLPQVQQEFEAIPHRNA